ncbi:YncE family protein [Clostridium tetani]|nr:YncE family protein [Clostridium tetani]RXI77695.1 YncE family protein [Clostridium tetani]
MTYYISEEGFTMKHLFICNTSSDYISKVNLEKFKEERKIDLNSSNYRRIGPHGICKYRDKLITANSYGNGISIVDIKENREVNDYFIGMHCNDVITHKDNAYIICGESNNVVMFDLIKNGLLEEIPCGNLPHSIVINKEKELLLISNMENDSLTLIDLNNKNSENIRVGAYPTKSMFSFDGNYIFACESNLGCDAKGSIAIISLKTLRILHRIKVGNAPIDMYYDGRYCYVSNFGDGTISIVDMSYYEEVERLIVGGMPRGIVKLNKKIYVGDNYNNLLIEYNIKENIKSTIPIGGEPTGMVLI